MVSASARRETILRDREQEARNAAWGLWSDPTPIPPWEWRKAARTFKASFELHRSAISKLSTDFTASLCREGESSRTRSPCTHR